MYVVAEGEIAIRKGDQTLAVLPEGQMLGEMALFEQEHRSADAVAASAARVFRIQYAEMRTFLLEKPECGARFLFGTSRELSHRLRRTSEYLTTVFETGRIVGAGLGLTAMAAKLLERLLADVAGATSATLLLYNPFGETWEIEGRAGREGLTAEAAAALVAAHAGRDIFQTTQAGPLLGVSLRDLEGEVFGYLLLEKAEGGPFTPQEEVVVAAVGQQTGLGILGARARQEEEDRRRLERGRIQGWQGGR